MKVTTILFNKLVKTLAGKKFTKNILVAKTFYYLKAMLKEKYVMINGSKIYLDKFDSLALSINKEYEPESVEIIKKHIKKTDVIIDIGANIGYYTILFARLGKEVHAFEPEPENFKLLQKNIRVNKITNAIIVQKAVSNKNGTVNLKLNKLNTGGHHITSLTKETIQIETIRLDNYIKQADFIKMDIEGAEILALNGMPNILSNPNLKLLVEYNPQALDNFGFDGTAFLLLLARHFTIMDVNTGKIIEDKESFVMQKKITNLFCYKGYEL